ncbi:unnamed protein product [Rotaria sp. Silwood1]|nr:unnamed protein product [Rotaria sp. Silwood1]CAF5127533.1 unnamed protein product [Rotaria sp. Silwood1]
MAVSVGKESINQRVLRFTDVAKEPHEIGMHISGYEKMPLVSLEQAVEPLVSQLPAIETYAHAAKEKCKKPADNLTRDESAAIMLYSMAWQPSNQCLYVALNAALRSTDPTRLKPWFLYLRLFLFALFHLPPIPKTTVFRGVKLNLTSQFQKGERIIWWGFSSCTTSVGVLQSETFLGKTGPRTMFAIECHSARDIRRHSYYPSEDEVLLLAATEFRVMSILDQGHDLYTVQLKEIQTGKYWLVPVPIRNNPKYLAKLKPGVFEFNDIVLSPIFHLHSYLKDHLKRISEL